MKMMETFQEMRIKYTRNIKNINAMNHIPQDADVLFTGLNPTRQALRDGALFSHDRSFWNLLERAGFYAGTGNIPAAEMYPLLVAGKLDEHLKIGLADLLPHIDEQHAVNVRVEPEFVHAYVEEAARKKVKRIGLMGDKVARAFAKAYPHLTYNSIQDKNNCMGKIMVGNHAIIFFSLPFPNNNSIPNKEAYYTILKNNN